MQYLGGKSRLAKRITQAILENTDKRERLIEPFVGGGATLAALAPHFQSVLASDNHPDLIAMWQALQDGWLPPDDVTEEQYKELRSVPSPDPLKGFVGFGCSFGGKWFGGYARDGMTNYAAQSKRSVLRDIQRMANVEFECGDYSEINVGPGDVIYVDPPYGGTTGYSTGKWDQQRFLEIVSKWKAAGADVFISEFLLPDYKEVMRIDRPISVVGDPHRNKASKVARDRLYLA